MGLNSVDQTFGPYERENNGEKNEKNKAIDANNLEITRTSKVFQFIEIIY